MTDTKNITVGTQRVAGSIYRAPLSATLPTSALTELGEEFESLGHVSDGGYSNNNSRSSKPVKDWGGNTVLNIQEDYSDTFKYKLIEALNPIVLKEVFGDDNVSGSLETELVVKANAKELTEHAYVIDSLLKGGYIRRTVIPCAKVTDLAEINYTSTDTLGYEITITAYPDKDENTHYEYTAKPQV